uniref:Secreted protein n=1 Tax=Peronospora matthiolae TaxID=2874970 RepID=A0AAV1TN88_9STRA
MGHAFCPMLSVSKVSTAASVGSFKLGRGTGFKRRPAIHLTRARLPSRESHVMLVWPCVVAVFSHVGQILRERLQRSDRAFVVELE